MSDLDKTTVHQPEPQPGRDDPPLAAMRLARRALVLGAAGAGAGMVAGLVAGADPAVAANGSPVELGKANTATATTSIATTVGSGLSARSSANGEAALAGVDTSASAGHGVTGASTNGVGVRGSSTKSSGVYGTTSSSTHYGVEAASTVGTAICGSTSADDKNGVEGVDKSTSGGYGVHGTSTQGTGVYGSSASGPGVSGIGDQIGVLGSATGGEAYGGVLGLLGAPTPPAAGVPILGAVTGYALLDQLAQTGVIGWSKNGTGVYGETDDGFNFGTVAVSAYDGSANGAYGLYATSAKGQAVYASGDATVTGKLSKGGGSFRIDHPLDPANKYLYHSFVESPDMLNIYNGNALLDDQGQATVELPNWFEALNKEFRYQLTPIGGAAPNLHISRKVDGGSFDIAGGNPGAEVSWMVTGIRQDAWAEANRIPLEVDKPTKDRGRYLHPELYGPDAKPVTELVQPNLHRPRLSRKNLPRNE